MHLVLGIQQRMLHFGPEAVARDQLIVVVVQEDSRHALKCLLIKVLASACIVQTLPV